MRGTLWPATSPYPAQKKLSNVDAGVDGYGDDGRITITIIFGTDYFAMFMRRTTIANFYF